MACRYTGKRQEEGERGREGRRGEEVTCLEGEFAGELQAHHHHASNPKEQNITPSFQELAE
jgi:hypothetical protein